MDDDEEILSDDAFDSEDEKMYGQHFSNRQAGGQASAGADSEADDDEDDGAEEEDGDFATLDQMLDESEAREKQERQKRKKRKRRGATAGHAASSDEEDDTDYDAMAQAAVGRRPKRERSGGSQQADRSELGAEDEYSVRPQSSLTAADLVASLDPSAATAKLRQRVDKTGAALAQPMPVPAQQRAERSVAYESTSKEVTAWQPTVKRNREADQLRFSNDTAHAGRRNVTSGSMQQKFKASSALEKEIESILQESGLEEDEVRKREDRELKQQVYTKEEVVERQKELQQTRALMFHQEKKAKRLKRIKSRSFRKLRKKDKEKAAELAQQESAELGGEAGEEARMKEERRRVEERMTQRHKNNSKWVKRQLALGKTAGGMNEGSRQAIAEQLRIGERLRRKVDDGQAGRDSDDEDDEEKEARWLEQTRQEVAVSGVGGNLWSDSTDGPAPEETQKGLFAMKFMQKAAEKQQAHVRDLLDEMDAEQSGSEEEDRKSDSEGGGDSSAEDEPQEDPRKASRRRKQLAAARAGRRTVGAEPGSDAESDDGARAGDNERLAEAARKWAPAAATRTQLSEAVAVQTGSSKILPEPDFPEVEGSAAAASSSSVSVLSSAGPKEAAEEVVAMKPATATASAPEWETVGPADGASSNPWLNQNGGGNKVRQKRRMGTETTDILGLAAGVPPAADDAAAKSKAAEGSADAGDAGKPQQLTRQALLERAFVGTPPAPQPYAVGCCCLTQRSVVQGESRKPTLSRRRPSSSTASRTSSSRRRCQKR